MAVASEVNHDSYDVKLFSLIYSRLFLKEDQQSKKLVIYVSMRKEKLHIKRYASDRAGFYGNITVLDSLKYSHGFVTAGIISFGMWVWLYLIVFVDW